MSSPQVPPWLQEQLAKLQQSQQNLQSVMAQKQHLEMERAENDRALEELQKAGDSDGVYKHAGSIMVRSTRQDLIAELEERREMAKTRFTVLEKQEARLKEALKEQESKITAMMKGGQQGGAPPGAGKPAGDDPRR